MCKNKDEFTRLVTKRRKLKALIKKLESKLEVVDDEIIQYARDKGSEGGKDHNSMVVFGDGYKVSVITVTQRPWDGDKLKAFLGDSFSDYQKTSTYSRIDIR